MSAKISTEEEAKRIVQIFEESLNHIAMGSNGIEDMLHERAVAVALLHVQGIIDLMSEYTGMYEQEVFDSCKEYYQQIRQSILNQQT